MGHKDERDAELVFEADELVLHVLTQLEVEGAEGLVEEKGLGLVYDGTGDGDALLLTARERVGHTRTETLEVHELQGVVDLAVDIALALFLDLEAEGYVLRHGHMGEEGVLLEHGVELPLVGGQAGDVLSREVYVARIRLLEAADDTQRCGFAATAGTQEGNELVLFDV